MTTGENSMITTRENSMITIDNTIETLNKKKIIKQAKLGRHEQYKTID